MADVDYGGNEITDLGTPVNPTDAATKAYVDAVIAAALVASGVSSINSATGPITMLGAGVSQAGSTFTFGGGSPFLNTNISKNVPTDYSTFQAACDAMNSLIPAPGITRTITVTGHQAGVSSIANCNNFFSPIVVRGATAPVSLTFSSIGTVTGSAGNWSVPITVANAGTTAVGDVLLIQNWAQSFPTQGGYPTYPVQGCYQFGISSSALVQTQITASAGSISATLTTSPATSLSGYMIAIAGQTRMITAHTAGTNTITVNSAWLQSVSGYNYWRLWAVESGTIAISGTTVTGTSTSFTTRVSPGDIFISQDGQECVVNSVSSNTSLTLKHSAKTLGAGAHFAIGNACWQHEGAFLVTGVSGNVITVKNTSYSDYAPPSAGLSSPTITCIKDSLVASSGATTGITLAGSIDIDQIAITGFGSTGNGIQGGNIKTGPQTAIIGFAQNAYIANDAFLYGSSSFFCGASDTNVNVTVGGEANLDSAYLHGATKYAVNQDRYIILSRARLNCNGSDGIRTDAGAAFYADWATCNGNGGNGMELVNGDIHYVGGQGLANHGDGANCSRAAKGGLTGSLFNCNGSVGVNGYLYFMEMDDTTTIGNGNYGIGGSFCMITTDTAGVTNNFGNVGYDLDRLAIVNAPNAYIFGHSSEGILTNQMCTVNLNSAYLSGSAGNDVYCSEYSQIYTGSLRNGNLSQVANVITANGLITNGGTISV